MVPLAHRILKPIERFLQIEAASGILLLVAATIALVAANSRWSALYDGVWSAPVTLGVGPHTWRQSVHFWINDGLMTIFFLLMGLEIRNEIHDGALAQWRTATLPLIAAVTGVAAPALIYRALNGDPTLRHGWAIPTATDIAFAVGVLTLLGKRIPPALRTLLLTLAIVDDVVAMLIIAVFYSSGIDTSGLLIAGGGVLAVLGMQRMGIRNPLAYAVPGAVVWGGMLRAGVHPALAGVVLGLLTPAAAAPATAAPVDPSPAPAAAGTPLGRLEALLHPWVAFLIMPLFALANAGVHLHGLGGEFARTTALSAGVALGLVIGKPIGIVLGAAAAVRLRLAALPTGVDWRHLLVLGCLGGIGFTMSIFIGALAFANPQLLAVAKFAVLFGSLLSALLGLGLGRALLRPQVP